MRAVGRRGLSVQWVVIALALVAGSARAAPDSKAEPARRYVRELKAMEREILHAGARGYFHERDARRARRGAKPARVRAGQDQPRDFAEAGGPQGVGVRHRPRVAASGEGEIPTNHRITDRSQDAQSEVSIAAHGLDMVAGWNDAHNTVTSGALGFGYSVDGGETWVDGDGPPLSRDILRWTSDPVIAVNEKTGTFYFCGMAITRTSRNAIAVAKGRFTDTGFRWNAPHAARSVRDTLPDKPWLVADSLTGALYLTYTTFFRRGGVQFDQIEFQRSTDDGDSWSLPTLLSSPRDYGLVQGSRPAVGPDGEVHIVWMAVDTSEAGAGVDYIRFRASRDQGQSFLPEETISGYYANFGSGAPGYNRPFAFVFPGIAVDRSSGPHRGRVYVTWNEALDYFDDPPVDTLARVEVEPNYNSAVATPFRLGETIRGAISDVSDFDLFGFDARQGQTVVFYLDSLATGLDVSLRILCTDAETRLAFNALEWDARRRVVLFTVPTSARYFARITPYTTGQGGYRLHTGVIAQGPERARDHRDVFVSTRDPGDTRWSTPVRVNDDPPWFDDWMPEVAVSRDGIAYVAWYDWRDAPPSACGGWSNVYLARSDDGGSSWIPLGRVSDVSTNWTEVISNIAPNQGDYIALFAEGESVLISWADGRDLDPDVYMARRLIGLDLPPSSRVTPLDLERVGPNPTTGELDVAFTLVSREPATIELIDLGGRRWVSLEVGDRGPGSHRARVTLAPRLPTGIYLVRLTQRGSSVARKVAVIR